MPQTVTLDVNSIPSIIKNLVQQQNTVSPAELSQVQSPLPQDAQPSLTVPGQGQQPQAPPPAPMDAINQIAQPGPAQQGGPDLRSWGYNADNGAQPAESKIHKLMRTLTYGAVGAAEGAGRRTFGEGFETAEQGAMTRRLMPMEVQARQAQLADTQAQTRQRDLAGQMATVQGPDGRPVQMPVSKLSSYYGSQIGAKGRTDAANIAAKAKLTGIQLEAGIKAGQVARLVDTQDPETGQIVKEAFNNQGQSLGIVPHSVVVSTLAKTSDGFEYKEDANGVMHVLPKRTVTGTQLPPTPSGSANPQQNKNQVAPNAYTGAPSGSMPANGASGQPLPTNAPGGILPRPPAKSQAGTVAGFQGKAGAEMGYAYDQNNKLQYVKRADAAGQGLQDFQTVKPSDVRADKGALRMLNDVQVNKSRYTEAAQTYLTAGKGKEIGNDDFWMAKLITPGNGFGTVGVGGVHLTMPFSDVVNTVVNSDAYTHLSPEGKQLLEGYIRAMGAVPAYQKALTGIGRSNKEMLDLELANIPNPLTPKQDIVRRLGAFQDNIDRASEGFPQFPDMKPTDQIRGENEHSWSGAKPQSRYAHQPVNPPAKTSEGANGKEIHYKIANGQLVPQQGQGKDFFSKFGGKAH